MQLSCRMLLVSMWPIKLSDAVGFHVANLCYLPSSSIICLSMLYRLLCGRSMNIFQSNGSILAADCRMLLVHMCLDYVVFCLVLNYGRLFVMLFG